MKPAYKLVDMTVEANIPQIVKVDVTDTEGLSWRDVKKQLRNYFLLQAKSLRSLTEKEFNGGKVS